MLVVSFLPFLRENSFPEPVLTSPSTKASSKVPPGPSGSLDVNKLEMRCSPAPDTKPSFPASLQHTYFLKSSRISPIHKDFLPSLQEDWLWRKGTGMS